ncbi:MAG: sigma 54-interacting transcriptional regulator [Desulfarculaceae bacterium]|nr:sigma 54-interacting transcriptional regulator [Desulfarculaceae bacterium]MCF8071196.1 sigma 54-interacting transcriptional regulator [Desulfarculaceae bacterium]MCF8101201.1 sigma 54-interacting transcriptional regulator [Desulfarculaceae bacterium]MCF8115250.1 sigma 54-interacting transcriptional regulator [Desulfarculaceae bacterium]
MINQSTPVNTEQRILRVASLFDDGFSIDWLQEVAKEKPSLILKTLHQGIEDGWLAETTPGHFRFTHPKRRQNFLEGMTPEERQGLYQRTIESLRQELQDEGHLDHALAKLLLHVDNDLDGCRRLVAEGNLLRKQYCHQEALQYFEKASKCLAGIPGGDATRMLMETAIQISKISMGAQRAELVNSFLLTAIERAEALGQEGYQGLLKMHLAKQEWLRSNFKVALELFDQGWAMAQETDDPYIQRSAFIFSMFFHYWQGRYRNAVESYEKDAPQVENVPKAGFPLMTRLTIGFCYCHCGQVSQGLGMLDSIHEQCHKIGHIGMAGHVSSTLTWALCQIGLYAEADVYCNRALDETTLGHNNFGKVGALACRSYLDHKLGNNDKAHASLREFLKLSQHTQIHFRNLPIIMELCWCMEQGLLPRFQGLSLEKEIADALDSQNVYMCGLGCRYTALLKKLRGEPSSQVVKNLEQAIEWLEVSGHQIELAKTRLDLAVEYLQQGEEERAKALAGPSAQKLFSYNESLIPDGLRSLLGDMQDREHLLDEILKLGQEMVTIRDNREVAVRIISLANSVTGAERGAIFLTDGETGRLSLRAAKNLTRESLESPGFAASLDLIEQTFRAGKVRFLEFEPNQPDTPSLEETIRSCICVPLCLRDQVIGVLYHDNRLFKSAFRQEDLDILGYFAAQAAIAMDNAMAYETLREMYQKQVEEKQYLEEQHLETLHFEEIVGESPAMQRVFGHIDSVSATDATVLILGETGVGKELVARAIHRNSGRRNGPFIRVNCSSFSEHLISSELFGHEKGSFTGAVQKRIGRFELADQGTIFLDEIGDMPLNSQVQLLRVLQSKEFERVGGHETIRSDFRLMAATNRDLPQMIEAGSFREDLYYRLSVFPIQVPPLRERPEDIPLLSLHFLQVYAKRLGKKVEKVPNPEMQKLLDYTWPGNVRELENIIERGVILSTGPLYRVPTTSLTRNTIAAMRPDMSLDENERSHILNVLDMTGGKVRGEDGAAAILNIHPNTLYSRMKKLGIAPARKRPRLESPDWSTNLGGRADS